MDKKIMSCTNSILCPIWTEWKCIEHKETIRDESICDNCEFFKKRSKDDSIPECHCETCKSQSKDNVEENREEF